MAGKDQAEDPATGSFELNGLSHSGVVGLGQG